MKRLFVLLILSFSITMIGCADTPESLARDLAVTVHELVDILETVKSEESAERAVDDIVAMGERVKKLNEREKKLGGITPEKRKEIKEKYKPFMDFETERMQQIQTTLESLNPETQLKIAEAVMEMAAGGE